MSTKAINAWRSAVVAALGLMPVLAQAQGVASCSERTYRACAVRIRDDRVIVRGIASQPIGTVGLRGRGLRAALAGSDSAVFYARAFATKRQRGFALSLFSGVVGALVSTRIHSIHDTRWIALGGTGIVATAAGGYYTVKANTAAQQAVWWYNYDVSARPSAAQAMFPSDSIVLGPLRKLVDMTPGAGVVMGLIDHDGTTRVITHGVAGAEGVPLDDRTVFEVGSITKLFTANVLASMALSRDVALDDPVSRYLPLGARPRPFDGREITLIDLAMHVSGLPRVPSNMAPYDSLNPYARYTQEKLFSYLASYSPIRAAGYVYEYSNLGYGLLGVALAARAGTSYDSLVRSRLLGPLGMTETRIGLDSSLGRRLARGHGPDGHPQSNWELGTLTGAGAYRSTLRDLMIYARANLASDGQLHEVLVATQQPRSVPAMPRVVLGMGWQHGSPLGELPGVVWKDGETGGYSAFIGLDHGTKRSVVIVANVAGAEALDAVGLGLLRVKATPSEPVQQAIPDSVLASYVGEYALSATFHMKVTITGSALSIQGTGQATLALVPVARDTFDVAGVAARVTFTRDAGGRVVSLTLTQNGSSAVAPRVP